jgi:hypothetical protein
VSAARELRLLGLWLIVVGSLGTGAALAGHLAGTDGSAAFPASVAIGIMVIVSNRPDKARKRRG